MRNTPILGRILRATRVMMEGGADPQTDVKYFETSNILLLVRRSANRKRWIIGRFDMHDCRWCEPVCLKSIHSTETHEEAEQALIEYAKTHRLFGIKREKEWQ